MPVRSEQIATVSLPSLRADCGEIAPFAGAFSFINSDLLVAFTAAVGAVVETIADALPRVATLTIAAARVRTFRPSRALRNAINR